jgi:hypothetical protein
VKVRILDREGSPAFGSAHPVVWWGCFLKHPWSAAFRQYPWSRVHRVHGECCDHFWAAQGCSSVARGRVDGVMVWDSPGAVESPASGAGRKQPAAVAEL